MIDQLIIGTNASYDDFEASVKERKVHKPKKKSIKETVPFSNVTYDFTAINGEIYWGETTLEYVFETTANTPEELEEKKQLFTSWIMNVMNAELHDPFIHGYHFNATFDSIGIDDSEIEKSTITVTFTAYPYMISNTKKSYSIGMETEEETTVKIMNDSSHRITPTFIADVPFYLIDKDLTYTFPAGETTVEEIIFGVGENMLKVKAKNTAGMLRIEFYEEVF